MRLYRNRQRSLTELLAGYMRCPEKLHPSLRRLVENEHSPSRQDMLDAYNNIAKLKVQWDEIAKGFDLVITPSAVDEAPYGLHNTGNAVGISLNKFLQNPPSIAEIGSQSASTPY